jgi:SAM-dependent methyltransferase
MDWKMKAAIQAALAKAPAAVGERAYYQMQSRFGSLNVAVGIDTRFAAASSIAAGAERAGRPIAGGHVLEVGSGRVPLMPIAFWLMGAESVTTVDLNPYLKPELAQAAATALVERGPDEVDRLVGGRLDRDRFATLTPATVMEVFDYRAPADATDLGPYLDAVPHVDVHVSNTTLEHIGRPVLVDILAEAGRRLSSGGVVAHLVDYTDHFSHGQPELSRLHFLQFSERRWGWIAGNRFAYTNRLRHDDMLAVFADAGLSVVEAETTFSDEAVADISSGRIDLDVAFTSKSIEVLGVLGALIVAVTDSQGSGLT